MAETGYPSHLKISALFNRFFRHTSLSFLSENGARLGMVLLTYAIRGDFFISASFVTWGHEEDFELAA
jgi:hypothetical protein